MQPTSSFHLIPDDTLIPTMHLCIIKDQVKTRHKVSVVVPQPRKEMPPSCFAGVTYRIAIMGKMCFITAPIPSLPSLISTCCYDY